MRRACLTLVAISTLLMSGPARAQTYDPSYPVCMQIYGPVGYFDCRYTSLQQCQYLAVGRSCGKYGFTTHVAERPRSPRKSRRAD